MRKGRKDEEGEKDGEGRKMGRGKEEEVTKGISIDSDPRSRLIHRY